jgi:4-amino-4-deoxy-L-arabinose transferase-like glycosyltransferase
MALVQNPSSPNQSSAPSSTPSSRNGAQPLAPRRAALLLALGTLLLYGLRLGNLDFWAPDEPRYGAIAEELRSFRHGAEGLMLLHLNGAPYTQKPPLYFWLAALAGMPGDRVTEWAARLPSAIAGLGCVGLTAFVGRRLFAHPMLGLIAAGMLATSFRFAFTARRAQLDVLLTSFELLAIALFLSTEFRSSANSRDDSIRTAGGAAGAETAEDPAAPTLSKAAAPSVLAIAGIHAALGAAALVKGPVGWLPLAIIAAYLAWEGRIGHFRSIAPIWAWFLSIGPVCLWMSSAIALAPPGFADVAVTENLLGRFFSGTAHSRPFYYFAYQTPIDFLPWTLFLPFGLPYVWAGARGSFASANANSPPEASAFRFILVWIAVPLLFFSVSAGKRGVYFLPVFPALALVAVTPLGRWASATKIIRADTRRAAIAIAIVAGIELAAFAFAAPMLESEKSPRPIAEAAARRTRIDEPVGVYGLRPIEGAIAYYGDRSAASLDDPAAVLHFFETGGRFVLMRERHFEQLRVALHLSQVEVFRSYRRRLVLVERQTLIPQGAPQLEPSRSGREAL